jgi:hypothetical protein
MRELKSTGSHPKKSENCPTLVGNLGPQHLMHKIQNHYGNNKHNISEGAYGKKKIEIHITLTFCDNLSFISSLNAMYFLIDVLKSHPFLMTKLSRYSYCDMNISINLNSFSVLEGFQYISFIPFHLSTLAHVCAFQACLTILGKRSCLSPHKQSYVHYVCEMFGVVAFHTSSYIINNASLI